MARRVFVGASVLGAAVTTLSAAAAVADDGRWEKHGWSHEDRGEAEETREAWQRHEWLEHEADALLAYSYGYVPTPATYYGVPPRVIYGPPVVYGPPPAVYAPPALNFGFTFGR